VNDARPNELLKSDPVRVLLVEDDPDDALLFQHMLLRSPSMDFRFERVDRLSDALNRLAADDLDIVLLDLSLPDSNGLETFTRLHATDVRVPIVVFTGLDNEALAIQTVQAGAQDYIVKGQVDRSSLVRTIRYAIERQRAQTALSSAHDLLRSLIDNIPDQVYVKDVLGRFVSVNSEVTRFFGATSAEQIHGKSDFDFFPENLATHFFVEEQALLHRDQPCINREASITDPAGNIRWVLTTKVPLRDSRGNVTGLLGINHDITERKRAEDAIRHLNESLEQRVITRTSELKQAVTRLEEQNQARMDFVSNVSHELKTPLTSMTYAIGNLLLGVAGPVPERVVAYLKMLNEDCQRMSKTVADVLDLSRLESKTLRLNRTKHPFGRLIRRGIAALQAEAQAKNMEIVMALDQALEFVECDVFKMERVIINLVGNAIKYTPEGGKIEIVLSQRAAHPGILFLEITDNGIGIAPRHLSRVSEKYYRVGEHVSGAGLGLSIAKEIIDLHGGRLEIQSPPPGRSKGTQISVSLPTVEPPIILTVADDSLIRESLVRQIAAHGYRVITCMKGEAVLECIRQEHPDILIFDLFMLARDGETVILHMKSEEALRGIPILVITSGVVSERSKLEVLEGFGIPIMQSSKSEEELLAYIEAALISQRSVRRADLVEEERGH
jgi:PAS domain S-box-containing protein